MRLVRGFGIGLAFSLLLFRAAVAEDKPAGKGVEGIWQGALKVGAIELRLVFHVEKKGDGLTAKMDSPDQGANGIPIDEVAFKDGTLKLELKKLLASYEGKLADDGKEIAGTFKQAGQTFPLTLQRSDKPLVLNRPQEPKKPYPYREEEVSYENKKAGVKFAGTLTLPPGDGPFPAVLLITGSGPQDRNESLLGHKPFLVLADHLTRKGIAVLRVDDRGFGGSTGSTMQSTTADFADDAVCGVEYLKGRKEINPKQIGLIGHSEGGVVAPLAATRSNDIAFIVLMAGTGLVGEEILYLQGALIVKSMGGSDKDVARTREAQEGIFKVVKEEKDNAAAATRIKELEEKLVAKLDEKERKELEKAKAVSASQAKAVLTPWFRYFLTYDPAPVLRQVRCPVLAINGEKDLQVPPKENLPAIEKALKAGGNTDVTVKELPGLNHLFQTSKTGAVSEYGKIEETIAPVALETMADWILKRTGKAK
jgi:uncharacterized protein